MPRQYRLAPWVLVAAMAASAAPIHAQRVTKVVVTHRTATLVRSATNGGFSVILNRPGPDCDVHIPGIPGYNERAPGQVDQYVVDVSSCGVDLPALTPSDVGLKAGGTDAWLPSSIKIVARTSGGAEHTIVDRSWPNTLWFSKDASEFIAPWQSQAEWMMDAVGSNASGNPIERIDPSSVLVTFRHKFYVSTGTIPSNCNYTVTLRATLKTAAPGGVSGSGSARVATRTSSGQPVSVGGSYWACDVSASWDNMKAGSWEFLYQLSGGGTYGCVKTVPLTNGRINFSSGKTGCGTGINFP